MDRGYETVGRLIKGDKEIDYSGKLWVSCFCQQGTDRKNNEDSVFFRDFPHERYAILGVADGMGGLAEGEVASALVCRIFNAPIADNPEKELEARAKKANSLLYSSEVKQGTTIAIVVIDKKTFTYYTLSVGDSRIYKYSSLALEQLTVDDSSTPYSSALLRFLGFTRNISNLDITSGKTAKGDSWLLSTDGIHSFVNNDDIRETIQLYKRHSVVGELAKQAFHRGSGDDMTTMFCVIN